MKKIILTVLFFLLSLSLLQAQYNKVVAKDGSGDYTTVQAAIDAAPTNSVTAWVIYIKNGKYYEKINVPSNKPNLQIIGESVAGVMVHYDDYAGKPLAGGGTLGTQNSASVTINANDFVAVNVTFANTFNYDSASAAGVTGLQAVAVVINADRSAFKNCRFIGMQDTLYTKGSGTPRHYFYKCYIDGIIDFIFGSSIAIFDSCTIYPKARTGIGNSYITAANTTTGQAYGYWFKDCKIPANTGATMYYLGRPWNNATGGITAANKTVYTNTIMGGSINPLGWSVWDAGTNTSVITYGEYKSKKFDGSLVDVSNRVSWSKQFTDADTVGYNILNVFNGWNPCSVRTDFCNSQNTELAVSNFKGVKNGSNINLSWNISWAITGIAYDVYRSIDNKASFQLLTTTTATNDSSINFSAIDAVPPSCMSYFYFVKASNSGYTTTYTDTIEVSSVPTINTTSVTLTNFLQGGSTPSAAQSVIINGVNLLNNITITPPVNFEISLDNTNWTVYPNSITLNQTSGNVTNTTLYVRLNAGVVGSYLDTIKLFTTCTSSTITKIILVNGTAQTAPLVNYDVIQQWDLTVNNLDNTAVRAVGLTATTPTFSRLNLSNGTQVSAVPAYSTLYGQAIAPSAAGDGMWTTASGGSGGNLIRTLYEQFTIKPDVNYSVRVDSILALLGYYGSTSNTKLAMAYSKSNFVSDSFAVTGGRDLSGTTLPGSANGAFTTPIVVTANSNSGNTSLYAFALNAGNGVMVNAGETLTIRIYFSCGSTSAGRYAVVKNVQAKGLLPQNLPLNFTNYQVKLNNNKQLVNTWSTSNEINVSNYNIERSVNAKDFVVIGKVIANNKPTNNYTFIDDKLPLTNDQLTIYYRIAGVDNDGRKTFSEVRKLVISNEQLAVSVFPNPAKDLIHIESKEAISNLSIIDFLGKTLAFYNYNNSNINNLSINTNQYPKGIYNVRVLLKNNTIVFTKFVVQ